MRQHGVLLIGQPPFDLVKASFPGALCNLCSSLRPETHVMSKVISRRSLAERMYIIARGTYNLLNICGGDTSQVVLNDINYIAEVSLFARFAHVSTLVCVTIAEAVTLSGYRVAESVRESPSCSSLVYVYAIIIRQGSGTACSWWTCAYLSSVSKLVPFRRTSC